LFLAQYAPAIAAAEELIATVPEAVLRIDSPPMADLMEACLTMKQRILVRFGKWQAIIEQELPENRALYCSNVAMLHYAKAVAHSALGNVAAAEIEQVLFMAAKSRVPESWRVHNNTVVDLLGVAEAMLNGKLEYRHGNFDLAFAHLRRCVELDDNLPYDEPWGSMQPTRHALGALLLEQNRLEEAEAAYRSDLGLDGKLSRGGQGRDAHQGVLLLPPDRDGGRIAEAPAWPPLSAGGSIHRHRQNLREMGLRLAGLGLPGVEGRLQPGELGFACRLAGDDVPMLQRPDDIVGRHRRVLADHS